MTPEPARVHFAAWARSCGLPFQTPAERIAIDPAHRGWRASAELVHENASWRYLGEWRLNGRWSQAALAWGGGAAEACAGTLPFPERAYASFAATLVGWEPSQFTYDRDPARWLVEHALIPAAVHYIRSLDTADAPDESVLEGIADELLGRLSSGRQRTRITTAVAGLTAEAAVSSGGLTVRPLSPHERGDLLRRSTGQQPSALVPLASA